MVVDSARRVKTSSSLGEVRSLQGTFPSIILSDLEHFGHGGDKERLNESRGKDAKEKEQSKKQETDLRIET